MPATTTTPIRLRPVVFTATLTSAMAAGTFLTPAVAVLATFIIDDLGLSRGQLGLAPAVFAVVAAVASPAAGHVTDHIGSRLAVGATFLFAGIGLAGMTLVQSVWTLVLTAGVAGIGQAFANPGTNKALAVNLPDGRRGLATGIKQSGVQLGLFLAGMAMPTIAVLVGWRATIAATGLAYLAWLLVLPRAIPADHGQRGQWRPDRSRVPADVWWLAAYGLLMGAAGGAVTVYLPLYAEEGLGMSAQAAGVLAGMTGLAAFVARIAWSSASERVGSHAGPLAMMAAVAAASTAVMVSAPDVGGTGLLWLGALGHATTGLAWNSVGMLAVMAIAGSMRAGRASGIVLLGFLGGFGLGPPLFGRSVDVTGSYRLGLAAAAAAFAVALVCTAAMRRAPDA